MCDNQSLLDLRISAAGCALLIPACITGLCSDPDTTSALITEGCVGDRVFLGSEDGIRWIYAHFREAFAGSVQWNRFSLWQFWERKTHFRKSFSIKTVVLSGCGNSRWFSRRPSIHWAFSWAAARTWVVCGWHQQPTVAARGPLCSATWLWTARVPKGNQN